MWRSAVQTEDTLDVAEHAERLDELFALREFWRSVVYPSDYRADSAWPEYLALSKSGQSYLKQLTSVRKKFNHSDFLLALFGHFYHHDIIFDWTKCDTNAICNLLDNELRTNAVRLPHRFGRSLYDRFNDMPAPDRTDHLLPEQVAELMKDTPQGVYQCISLVSGPMGVLRSQESRYLPPSLRIPLWHCSDTGCNAIHTVYLRPPPIPVVEAYQAISQAFDRTYGPASEWKHSLCRRHRKTAQKRFQHGRRYNDLPVLLAETFVGDDLAKLAARSLRTRHAATLREVIATRSDVSPSGSPEKVAQRLDSLQRLQLLLLLPDADLIQLIDESTNLNEIKIPIGEIRRARQSPPRLGYDRTSEVSALGVRSVRDNPWATLIGMIWRAHRAHNLWDDLEWRLRTAPGASVKEQLCEFARVNGPAWVLEELVLKSRPISQFVCDECEIVMGDVPDTAHVTRLLWKLGFNPTPYDDHIPRLLHRLSSFNETLVAIGAIINESDRERIRSAGVNLFVSVEDFLERLISFNVWLLKNDHFIVDKFRFDPKAARNCVADALGTQLADGETTFAWQREGGNAIGTLMRYLDECVKWFDSRLEADKEPLLRPDGELPHYSTNPNRGFKLRHVEFWADADRSGLGIHVERFRRLARFLQQAQLAFVRNGLDHHREESQFPTIDAMLGCAARLREAVETADIERFFPKMYWLENKTENRNRWTMYEFSDFKKRPIALYGPSMAIGLPPIRFDSARIIAPGNLLGEPNANLIFTFHETTEYKQYWSGYPRRRQIPSNTAQESDDALSADQLV